MADKLEAHELRMANDLSLTGGRGRGQYIGASRGVRSIGIEEPALSSEPGVFNVRSDGMLYYGAVQTMPCARPCRLNWGR